MTNENLLSLPTELLHHIFNYCDSKTVFLSVRRVCQRLQAATETYDRVQFNVIYQARNDSQLIRRLIQPSTIRSLTVLDDKYAGFSESREDISFLDIPTFNRLRSLTFYRINAEKLGNLLPSLKMHSLDSLSITTTGWNCETPSTLLILGILHLNPRRLFLKSYATMTSFSFSPIDCRLEHLRVNECDQLGYFSILRQLPSLQTFVIDECKMNRYEKTVTSLIGLSYFSRLTSLTINQFLCKKKTLALLFSVTPALVYLKLSSNQDKFHRIFDGLYWEELISRKLQSLKTFEFFFCYRVSEDANFLDVDPPVSSFQREFWLREKNWIVNCAYVINSPEIWLYTNKFRIQRREYLPMCEISSIDNVWRFRKRSSDDADASIAHDVRTTWNISRNYYSSRRFL